MNFNEELLSKLDDYAKQMNITRTSAVAVICSQYFQSVESVNTLDKALKIYEKEKSSNK